MPTAQAILADWGLDVGEAAFVSGDDQLTEMPLAEASRWIDVAGAFGEDCVLLLDPERLDTSARLKVRRLGSPEPVRDLKLCLLKNNGGLTINVGGDDCRILLGRHGHAFSGAVNIWGDSRLAVGDGATCNEARIILARSDVIIGPDCMLSDEIIIQSSDQHDIIDLATGDIINRERPRSRIGRHVWIGRRTMLMPGVEIGSGAIIAAGALVSGQVDPCVICAGVPARVIRRGVSWTRQREAIDAAEQAFFDSMR